LLLSPDAVDELELPVRDLRHLLHHAGQAMDTVRSASHIGVAWVLGIFDARLQAFVIPTRR